MGIEQERFQLLCGIFSRAARIADAAGCQAFVERACKDHPSLAEEVHGLLRIYDCEPAERMGDRIRAAIEKAERDFLR